VQGPFVYDAQTPSDISFVPLRAPTIDGVVTPGAIRSDNLLAAYEKDTQLKEYVPIIKNEPKYPVIRDANGVVLSLPPIINSDHSKISLNTKNIFIECTATDMTKAKIVLNMIVCMFTEYCAKPFTVEPVDVIYPDGDVKTFPDLSTRTETLPVELINRRLGINCWGPKIAQLLSKMQLPCEVADDGQHLNITVPPVRPDIIHGCDIWEDVAIAYGYNNIKRTVPTLEGINGRQQPVNELADKVRLSIAQAGFTEALTFALCTKRDGFENMRRVNDGQTAAVVSKPCTQIFQMVRVNLISGLLKTLSENQGKLRIPIRVFEVGDVVLLNKENETGASNHRRVAAVICANSPHFEDIQGLFEHLMRQLGASRTNPTDDPAIRDKGYYLTV